MVFGPPKPLPAEPRRTNISSSNILLDFTYVENGIFLPTNDSFYSQFPKFQFPFYVRKVQGSSLQYEDETNPAGGNGVGSYIDRDSFAANRYHGLFSFGNKVYLKWGTSNQLVFTAFYRRH